MATGGGDAPMSNEARKSYALLMHGQLVSRVKLMIPVSPEAGWLDDEGFHLLFRGGDALFMCLYQPI